MEKLKEKLIKEAMKVMDDDDPSHDLEHALRVLRNAERISEVEGGDLSIIIPAALFHDSVNYPKNDPRSRYSAKESGELARGILEKFSFYDEGMISKVEIAILEHSYSGGIKPTMLESKIIQDADRLECLGAISIMRSFCSTGQMSRPFYNTKDPFCENREPDPGSYTVDLFYARYFSVLSRLNTDIAKEVAEKRIKFMYEFLDNLKDELLFGYKNNTSKVL